MNILVNAIPLTGLLTGISRYLRNLYAAMGEVTQQDTPRYYSRLGLTADMPPQAEPEQWIRSTGLIWKLPDPAVFALRSLFWLRFEHGLRRMQRTHGFDLYHETAFVPAKLPGVPQVYTIYDLSLVKYARHHPKERVMYFNHFFKRRIRYATCVLTISEFIRQELIHDMGLPPEQVHAVPLAQDPVFGERPAEAVATTLAERGWPKDYLLFVGSLEPRKNLPRLIDALERCASDIPLLLAGWSGWGDKGWLEELKRRGLDKRVLLTGYVDNETLVRLYNGATALVYPSLYEGFGLPVLEAMACGCPVICSHAASLPEVAGDAAVTVPPEDADALAAAIDRVAGSDEVRADLRRKGLERAALFSWQQTARGTLEVFRRAAGTGA